MLGNVLVGFLLCNSTLDSEECKVITVVMDLVITATQDWLENNEYTNMDTAYDLGVAHGMFLNAHNSHDGHAGFISWWAGTTFSDKFTNRLSNWITTADNSQRHSPESSAIPAPVGIIKSSEVTHSLRYLNGCFERLILDTIFGRSGTSTSISTGPSPFIQTNTSLGRPISVLRLVVVPKKCW